MSAAKDPLAEFEANHPITPLIEIAKRVAPKPIDQTISERRNTHGDFRRDAATAQALKHVMREGENWGELSSVQREALEHVATKIARILAGDPNYKDHWLDVIGYFTLVVNSL